VTSWTGIRLTVALAALRVNWYCRRLPLDRLIERTTPEDILIKKEFWGLVYDYYDKVDVMVLLGMMDRKEAAAKFDMGYEAYTKSLQRKNVYFRDIATKAGYC